MEKTPPVQNSEPSDPKVSPSVLSCVLCAHVVRRQAAGLTGWAGIEEHLSKYDGGRMRGYSDDIDALLVFVRSFGINTVIAADQA